jgi:hypothetical protein
MRFRGDGVLYVHWRYAPQFTLQRGGQIMPGARIFQIPGFPFRTGGIGRQQAGRLGHFPVSARPLQWRQQIECTTQCSCLFFRPAKNAETAKSLPGQSLSPELTNGFSKKLENLKAAVPLHFVRLHGTMRVTPAIAAGVDSRVWSLEELVAETSR